MIEEDKRGAIVIIKVALVVFFVLFLAYLIQVEDENAKWALLWLFILGVFAKLKHKIMMQSIWKKTVAQTAKPIAKAVKVKKK